jgi:hypothetical protein
MMLRGKLGRLAIAAMSVRRIAGIRREAGVLPLYGPTDWSGTRMLGQWGWENGTLSYAGLAYGDPHEDSPWMEVVTTAGPADPYLISLRSAVAFESEPPRDKETHQRITRAASTPATARAEIPVDGVPHVFDVWPDQPLGRGRPRGWYGRRDGAPGLLVICAGQSPEELTLRRVIDIEPFLSGTRRIDLRRYDEANP